MGCTQIWTKIKKHPHLYTHINAWRQTDRQGTFCCCFWWKIRCSHCGMSWDVFSISCTALFRADCRSSKLGFITTLGMARTMSARKRGGLESILSASLLYLLKIWSLLLMASKDSRVPVTGNFR